MDLIRTSLHLRRSIATMLAKHEITRGLALRLMPSPLMKLPQEIRLLIYDFVDLSDVTPLKRHHIRRLADRKPARLIPLLDVCLTIRMEALSSVIRRSHVDISKLDQDLVQGLEQFVGGDFSLAQQLRHVRVMVAKPRDSPYPHTYGYAPHYLFVRSLLSKSDRLITLHLDVVWPLDAQDTHREIWRFVEYALTSTLLQKVVVHPRLDRIFSDYYDDAQIAELEHIVYRLKGRFDWSGRAPNVALEEGELRRIFPKDINVPDWVYQPVERTGMAWLHYINRALSR